MLHAKDLMIGDWVKFPGGAIDKIVDLPFIEGKGLCASFAASATLFPFPISKIEPIPITPEILKKNGFIENRGITSWKFETKQEDLIDIYGVDDYHLSINIEDTHGPGKGYRYLLYNLVIRYVHELQHALRLCGIEKEIEL